MTDIDTETQEKAAQDAPPQDTPEAPAETPEAPAQPETPAPEDGLAQLRTQMEAQQQRYEQQLQAQREEWQQREQRYMDLLAKQQPAQAQPRDDVDTFFQDVAGSFENAAAGAKMAEMFQKYERRMANKFAPRSDVEVLQRATGAIAGNAAERDAIAELRSMNIAEADIKTIQQRAAKEAEQLRAQGYYTPPSVLFRAQLATLQQEKGYTAASEAAKKKQAVLDRQQKPAVPPASGQGGNGQYKLTDKDFEAMDKMTMPERGRFMRSKGL